MSDAIERTIEDAFRDKSEDDDHDPGPWICPGCYAMGNEPHAGYCPDAAIERDHEDRMMRGEYDDWEDDGDE